MASLGYLSGARRWARWITRLDEPSPIGPIIYFRIIFGLTILAWTVKAVSDDWIAQFYVEPAFHFKYVGFRWVSAWGSDGTRWQFLALGIASLALTVGLAYRASALLVAVLFTHLFLVDKALYQNHHYLLSLLSWIAVFLPAGRAVSIDARLRPDCRSLTAPLWCLWLLRFQIAIPYIYGGIAKLEYDWLRGQPMRAALASRTDTPLVGQFFDHEWCVWIVVYGGLLFDLLIVPALLWRKTRPAAFVFALSFHLTNALVFDIGVFPWFMALSTVLFFPAEFFQRLFRLDQAANRNDAPSKRDHSSPALFRTIRITILGAYVVAQLVIPLRHFVYPGQVNWTEQGHHFAWHMMLRGKRCALRLYAREPRTGRSGTIDLRRYVRPHQVGRFARDPEMIHQLCRFIAKDLSNGGYGPVQIRALALVSLNGRKPQLLIDPTVDLVSCDPPELGCCWIVPLAEPLRARAWDTPLDEWEQSPELSSIFAKGAVSPQ